MDKLSMNRNLFDKTIRLLERSLDLSTFRHKVLSGNVANVETPNYAAKDISFQKALEQSFQQTVGVSLQKTHPDHLAEDLNMELEMRSKDGVNIDEEMAKLAENNLMFQAGVQALLKKLEALKVTIIEGGK
jgi:flagellar basal-body rod protein FlgB